LTILSFLGKITSLNFVSHFRKDYGRGKNILRKNKKKMAFLPLANITQKKTRTIVSIVAVSIEIALMIVIVGMTNGTLNNYARGMENIGGDILFQPPGGSLFFTLNSVFMRESIKNRLLEVEGVKGVSPVLIWNTTTVDKQPHNIFGVEENDFEPINRKLEILEGSRFTGPHDIIIDRVISKTANIKLGQEVSLLNQTFKVVGISRPNVGAMIYLPLRTLQDALGEPGKVSLFFVKCTSANLVEEVAHRLTEAFPGYNINILQGYSQHLAESISGIKAFNRAITILAIFVSSITILLAMYTAVMERTRQIGILKSIGASKIFIITVIVIEALIICFIGVLAGYGISYLSKDLLKTIFPMLTIELTLRWMIIAGILGLIGGVLGSLYPAYRAASLDPIKALRYE
jgi:putative ABC transport system permease protein